MQFLEWKLLNFKWNFIEICPLGSYWQHGNIGSDDGLVPNRRQAIIWTHDGLGYRRIYASLSLHELIISQRNLWMPLLIHDVISVKPYDFLSNTKNRRLVNSTHMYILLRTSLYTTFHSLLNTDRTLWCLLWWASDQTHILQDSSLAMENTYQYLSTDEAILKNKSKLITWVTMSLRYGYKTKGNKIYFIGHTLCISSSVKKTPMTSNAHFKCSEVFTIPTRRLLLFSH